MSVALTRVRVSHTRTTSITYPIAMPYCAAHGAQARQLNRYAQAATVGLFIAASVLLFAFNLAFGRSLRELGGLIWFGATLLMMLLLAFGAVVAYGLGRRLLQRRRPAIADHSYGGTLGVRADALVASQPLKGEELLLAITFTFHNDAYAAQVAALHGTRARPAQDP